MSEPRRLAEHFFRHEYGRLVATLSRRVGIEHLDVVEDAVQTALSAALESWPRAGVPDDPTGWLFRVARNRLWDELRQRVRREHLMAANVDELAHALESGDGASAGDAQQDALLRMLFVCCHEAIPAESQIVLALKVLCGFDAREIAVRLFTTDANVYKRLGRARARLREVPGGMDDLTPAQYATRLASVRTILYLIFTEGYLSSHAERSIRRELCDEAMRLTSMLAQHPIGDDAETSALMALMHLHSARLSARQNEDGDLLLLQEQDRDAWDRREIEQGLRWLVRSAVGDVFSRYHAEATIAAEHCLAPSFEETRWDKVIECYALLEHLAPSPLHRLNRALATAELHGPARGLEVLEAFVPPSWLAGSYMWPAVLADLHRRAGNATTAGCFQELARGLAPSATVLEALERRFRHF